MLQGANRERAERLLGWTIGAVMVALGVWAANWRKPSRSVADIKEIGEFPTEAELTGMDEVTLDAWATITLMGHEAYASSAGFNEQLADELEEADGSAKHLRELE